MSPKFQHKRSQDAAAHGTLLVIVFGLLACGIGGTGAVYFRSHQFEAQQATQEQLSAVADLKASQISRWYKENLSDAGYIMDAGFAAGAVEEWFVTPQDTRRRSRVEYWLGALHRHYDFNRLLLLDTKRQVRLAVPDSENWIEPLASECAGEALRERRVVVSDLHRSPVNGKISMDLLIPLFDHEQMPVGLLVIEILPERFLYPLIQSWPTASRTAETLLVRREGDEVVFLNELRHQSHAALNLRLPCITNGTAAARASLGHTGLVRSMDYRGVPVLAAMRAISDTPWALVAKVDEAEIGAPRRAQAWNVGVLVGALILAAGLAVMLTWRHLRTRQLQRDLAWERKSRALASRLATVMQHANDIIILADDHLRILEANHRAVESYGYTQEEFRTLEVSALRAPETRAGLVDFWGRLEKEEQVLTETLHVRKDGTTFPVEVSGRRIEVEGIMCSLAITRDITDRKQREQERERLLGELTRKSEELENLLYAASHDLRSPLVNIEGFSRRLGKACRELETLLADEGVPDHIRGPAARLLATPVNRSLQYIHSSVVTMNRLLSGLLQLSRLGRNTLSVERLDMETLARQSLDTLSFQTQKAGAAVTLKPLPACQGDARLVGQIFGNLLDNAIKYRDPARPLTIVISGEIRDNEAVYCVADNGIGILPEHLGKIWELFHRLHPERSVPGEGLGLNVVQRALGRLSGRTWAESSPGQGSRFYFALPGVAST